MLIKSLAALATLGANIRRVFTVLLVVWSAPTLADQVTVPWRTEGISAPTLGEGFTSRTGQLTGFVCVKGDPEKRNLQERVVGPCEICGTGGNKNVRIVTSTEDFRKTFKATASASVGTGPFAASGSASYSTESTSNQYMDRLLADVLVVRSASGLLNPEPHDKAPKPQTPKFRARCGDMYVSDIITGGRLLVEFRTERASQSTSTTVGGSASGGFSYASAAANIASAVYQASKSSSITSGILWDGGGSLQPTGEDGKALDVLGVAKFVDKWPDMFLSTTKFDQPVELILRDYDGLFDEVDLTAQEQQQLDRLDALGTEYEKAAEYLSGLRAIKRSSAIDPQADITKAGFGRVDEKHLDALIAHWTARKEALMSSGKKCAKAKPADVDKQCQSPEGPKVVPDLPRKAVIRYINTEDFNDGLVEIGATRDGEYLVIEGSGTYRFGDSPEDQRSWKTGQFLFTDKTNNKQSNPVTVSRQGCLVGPNTIVNFHYGDRYEKHHQGGVYIVLYTPLFPEDFEPDQKGCPTEAMHGVEKPH